MSDSLRKPVMRTTRDMIRGVADAWARQYRHGGSWATVFHGDAKKIWYRLKALNTATATPEDVAAIIGNNSWTNLSCDQCKRNVGAVVELGDAPDYESRTADICPDCLREAAKLVEPADV